jgi:hypothetical protein
MRIRFGVGLPGPFRLTGGHSRARGGGSLFAVVLVVLLCIARPWIGLAVGAFLVVVVVCVVHDQRHGLPVGRRR